MNRVNVVPLLVHAKHCCMPFVLRNLGEKTKHICKKENAIQKLSSKKGVLRVTLVWVFLLIFIFQFPYFEILQFAFLQNAILLRLSFIASSSNCISKITFSSLQNQYKSSLSTHTVTNTMVLLKFMQSNKKASLQRNIRSQKWRNGRMWNTVWKECNVNLNLKNRS